MSSSIDTKGIIKILFSNNNITTLQSISELYYNSDDSNAAKVEMYLQEYGKVNYKKEWFIFNDNGVGMSLNDMKKYLINIRMLLP
jgi:hypothetical protein